jgi:hypothetical protein
LKKARVEEDADVSDSITTGELKKNFWNIFKDHRRFVELGERFAEYLGLEDGAEIRGRVWAWLELQDIESQARLRAAGADRDDTCSEYLRE